MLKMPPTLAAPKLNLKISRRPNRQTLEHELPIFLNLLKVTTETGLNLPQSLKCLNQSLDISCPHLVETFTTILEHANAINVPLEQVLRDASGKTKLDFVAHLMTALAVPATTPDKLISIIDAQTAIAYSRLQKKNIRLSDNFRRRWTPHLVFFWIFVVPLAIVIWLGPALVPGPIWAIGGPYSRGIPF